MDLHVGKVYTDVNAFYAACQAYGRAQIPAFEGSGIPHGATRADPTLRAIFVCIGERLPHNRSSSSDNVCTWRINGCGKLAKAAGEVKTAFTVTKCDPIHSAACRLRTSGSPFIESRTGLARPTLPLHKLMHGERYDDAQAAYNAAILLAGQANPPYHLALVDARPVVPSKYTFRCDGDGKEGCACSGTIQRVLQGGKQNWMITRLELGHSQRCTYIEAAQLQTPMGHDAASANDALIISDDEGEDVKPSPSALSTTSRKRNYIASPEVKESTASPFAKLSRVERPAADSSDVDVRVVSLGALGGPRDELHSLLAAHFPSVADRLAPLVEALFAKGLTAEMLPTLATLELDDLLSTGIPAQMRALAFLVKSNLSKRLPLVTTPHLPIQVEGLTSIQLFLTRLHYRLGRADVRDACNAVGLDIQLLRSLSPDAFGGLLDTMEEVDEVCKVLLKRRVAAWREATMMEK